MTRIYHKYIYLPPIKLEFIITHLITDSLSGRLVGQSGDAGDQLGGDLDLVGVVLRKQRERKNHNSEVS